MTTDTLHPLAAEYLQRLRRAGRGLSPGRRRELLAEIEGHLSEAIDPSASDAQALTVLDKLGEPEAIIAAETQPQDELPPRRGTKEWAAIILLLFGGFIFGVGWFVGLILLWSSRAWTIARQMDRNARHPRRPRDQRPHRADLARDAHQNTLPHDRRRRTALHHRARNEHRPTHSRNRRRRGPCARFARDLGLSRPPRSLSHHFAKGIRYPKPRAPAGGYPQ